MANTSVILNSARAIADRPYSATCTDSRKEEYRCGDSAMGELLSCRAMQKLTQEPDGKYGGGDCGASNDMGCQEDEKQRLQAVDWTINKAISNLLDLSWLSPFIEKDGGKDLGWALAVLDRYFNEIKGKNNMVSREDLQKISEGKPLRGRHDAEISYADDLQAAARYMLKQQSAYESLDTAQRRKENKNNTSENHADGFFSKGDLASALSDTPLAENDMNVMRTLLRHIDELGSRVTQHDLEKIADGTTHSMEFRNAADYVLARKDLWTRMDTALRLSKCDVSEQGGDGIASAADIRVLADQPQFKERTKNDSA